MSLRFAMLVVVLVVLCNSCSGGGGGVADVSPDTGGPTQDVVADLAEDRGRVEEVASEVVPEVAFEVASDSGGSPDDVFSTGISAKGYAEFCTTAEDCAEWGLLCAVYALEDPDPFCTSTCETNLDCPEYYVCDYKFGFEEPVKVCMEAPYCAECQADIQCKIPGMSCIADDQGGHFCSFACNPGVLGCESGSRCVYREDEAGWFCLPYWGSCKGDGGQCSPCQIESDCEQPSYHCMQAYYTDERFCTKECETGADCESGYGCYDLGGAKGLCLMTVDGTPIPSCHSKTQDFCGECQGTWECQEGLACYIGPQNTGFYCSPECASDGECMSGTKCKAVFSLETGFPSGKYACSLQGTTTCTDLLTR